MTKENKPEIRFSGFSDAWKQRKVDDIANRFDNLRVPVAENERHHGNIPYYGANGIQDYVEGFTHDGEFILVAEDGANDLVNYPVQYVNGKIWVNNHAHVLQGKEHIDTKFLKYAFQTTNIGPYLVGGGRSKLNADVMMQILLNIPEEKEQIRVSNFIFEIENNITLQLRKLELLKNQKKAFLEKMFPKEGENVPEIRFSGFSDAWKQRELNEIADTIDTGKSIFSKSNIGKFKILGSTGVIGFDEDYDYEGSFLLTARVGANAGNLYRSSGKVKITDNTVFIKSKFIDYLFYSLEKFNLKRLSFGTGQPLIKSSELKKLNISVPCDENEITKIEHFFITIDRTITLQLRKLEILKNIKKSFLQKMFV